MSFVKQRLVEVRGERVLLACCSGREYNSWTKLFGLLFCDVGVALVVGQIDLLRSPHHVPYSQE